MAKHNDNLISIVLPTYNRRKTLKDTVDNILEQTYKNFELIIVDDDSTDGTEMMISQYNDNRIIYIKNSSNKGACYSRNRGVENARGIYIAFQDSDDLWKKDKLEKQIEFLINMDADITFCQMNRFDVNHKSLKMIPDKSFNKTFIKFDDLLLGNFVSTQTLLLKKTCFDNIKFDLHLPRFQDWDIMLQLSKLYKIVYHKESLVIQNIQNDSISMDQPKAINALQQIYEKYKYEFDSNKSAKSRFLDRYGTFEYLNGMNPIQTFKQAFLLHPSIKTLCKLVLCKSSALNYLIKVAKK